MIELSKLTENPKNARTISDEHFAALRHSVAARPWMFPLRPIVARRSDGVVLGGNMRLRALIANGVKEVPDDWVRWADLDERQCEEMHVVDNENFGDWIADDLLALYGRDRLAEMDVDVDALLKGVELPPADEPAGGKTDSDAVPEVEEDPKSRRGAVYACGRHRLMCGDATSAGDMLRLMGGGMADMVFTDPPYGVAIGDKNATLNTVANGRRCSSNIENDTLNTEQLYDTLKGAFVNVRESCKDDACYFVTSPQGGSLGLMMMMRDAGLEVRHVLIWRKNSQTFSLGRLDYDYQHEPIFYTWTKSHHNYRKGEYRSTVWNFDKPRKCDIHPTMKPVELVENAIHDGTIADMIVLDAFGGSGTTMIACEKTNRQARLMEIDPLYCDVIRRRWAEFVHGEGCDWEALTPEAKETE